MNAAQALQFELDGTRPPHQADQQDMYGDLVYGHTGASGCTFFNGTNASAQMCHDAVDSTDVTLAAVPKFHWINRPTFQQAVQYPDHR